MRNLKKILVIRTGALGDIILASASFQTLRETFPESKIYLLTKNIYKEVVEDCPVFEKIFVLYKNKNFFKFALLVKKLRRFHFDLIVDLQGNMKTNFYSFLFAGKERIGFYKKKIGKLFLTKGLKQKPDSNPVNVYKYFWESLGISTMADLKVWIGHQKKEAFKEYSERSGLKENPYIVIHPVASEEWKTKRWPKENFAKLSDLLFEKGYPVVFVGGQGSKEEIKEIIRLMKNEPVDLTEKTNISQLILLIKNSRLLVTTDSAPMHIGSACGVKTLAIFGPTDPKRHCPPDVQYIYKKIPCSFCYKKKCLSIECMKAIKIEDVLGKIEKLLELR